MTDIFISYSHKDEAWKDELQKQLRVLQLTGDFAVWDDRQIELGENWLPAIERAIASARVAILLVSSDFLTSSFVVQEEIPKFLQRREQDGLKVVPIIVRPCAWQVVPWLADLQGATKDNVHLSRFALGSSQLEEELSRVVLKVHGLLVASKAEEAHRLEQVRTEAQRKRQAAEAAREQEARRVREQQEAAERAEQERLQAEADKKARQEQQKRDALAAKKRQEEAAQRAEADKRERDRLAREKAVEDARKRLEAEEKNRQTAEAEKREDARKQKEAGEKRKKTAEARQRLVQFTGKAGKWMGAGLVVAVSGYAVMNQSPTTGTLSPLEPEMVLIKGGEFQMGCVSGKNCQPDELPVNTVNVPDFEIGKYEVTFAEWDVCVADGGCKQKPDTSWGRDQQPVINVSWNDAQEFVGWLSKKTNKPYRLPTEAEWEYAARAGTKTPFPTGDCINTDQANYNGNYDWLSCKKTGNYRAKTLPVGSLAKSKFGLYDMQGNVWEWVQDCYHKTYEGAPLDGSEWTGSCFKFDDGSDSRVLRGGSWNVVPEYLRSANRYWNKPPNRINNIGFRVSRTL